MTATAIWGLVAILAQSNCNVPPQGPWRWARNTTIYFYISTSLNLYRSQIETAISGWNTANVTNGSGVRFEPSSSANPPVLRFFSDTSQTAAGRTVPNSSFMTLEGASVFLNPNHPMFQPGASGSADFWTKVAAHELGHTMGMNDATGSCSDQPNGGSVMNMICGQNDSSGNMSSFPSNCDNDRVGMTYPPSNQSSGSYYYAPNGYNCSNRYWNTTYYYCDAEGCDYVGSDFYYWGVTCGY